MSHGEHSCPILMLFCPPTYTSQIILLPSSTQCPLVSSLGSQFQLMEQHFNASSAGAFVRRYTALPDKYQCTFKQLY